MKNRTVLAGFAFVAVLAGAAMAEGKGTDQVVDAQGNLKVPAALHTAYRFLGSWAVAPSPGQSPQQLHAVYASPGAVEAFRKAGKFPDGTVLVKEVFEAATGDMTTGSVSHAQTLKGWFVMVKDSANSHPGNKLWGDGWGWSWFDAANPGKTTSVDYETACKACHEPAKDTDRVYTDGYPALKH